MAKLPGAVNIEYSQTIPSGKGPAATGNLDVSTGAGAIAQGIMAMGDAFQKIVDQRDAVELSTMKRTFDEKSYAAFNAYSQTGDETARKALVEQWNKDIEGIRSKSARVNREFLIHKNSVLPHWGETFAKQEIAIQTKQVDDAAEINIQKDMGLGNVAGAAKEIQKLASLGRISQADAEQRIADLPIDSVLEQARLAIPSNPNSAEQMLEKIRGEKLSPDQMKKFESYLRIARETNKRYGDELVKDTMRQMTEADRQKIDPSAKETLIQKLTTTIEAPDNGLTAAEVRDAKSYMTRWQKGDEIISDPKAKTECIKAITDVRYGTLNADKAQEILNENAFKLNTKDRELYDQKLNTNLDYITGKYVNEAVHEWEMAAVKAEDYEKTIFYRFELEDWFAKNPNASPREQHIRAAELAAKFRGMTLKKIVEEEKKQEKPIQKVAAGTKLDNQTAILILREAGGDKEKARQIAKDRGYSF